MFLTKLNAIIPHGAAITFCGIYLDKLTNLGPPKNVHVNVYISFIHKCTTLETTKISFKKYMGKQIILHTHTHTHTMNLLNAKKEYATNHKGHIGTLNACYLMKETSLRSLHTV